MAEKIQQSINHASLSAAAAGELGKLLQAARADIVLLRADVASLITQFNQLRTDYNANATIATDTTATAVTNTSSTVNLQA